MYVMCKKLFGNSDDNIIDISMMHIPPQRLHVGTRTTHTVKCDYILFTHKLQITGSNESDSSSQVETFWKPFINGITPNLKGEK